MHLKWVSSFGKSTPCPTTPERTAAYLHFSNEEKGTDSVYYMGMLEG
jgi:hypothetical protein